MDFRSSSRETGINLRSPGVAITGFGESAVTGKTYQRKLV